MTNVQAGSLASPAALVGSLSAFSLVDVLDLLERTEQVGELQVVGHGIDQRIWLDKGNLLDPSSSDAPQTALFQLACIEEGWFYFTSNTALPKDHKQLPIASVISDLAPQVREWKDLTTALPFTSILRMAESTPSEQVQIRSDQWQLLSLVGTTGRNVRQLIDDSKLGPLETLRTLQELTDAGLIALESSSSSDISASTGTLSMSNTSLSSPEMSSSALPTQGSPVPSDPPTPPGAPSSESAPTSTPFVPPPPATTFIAPKEKGGQSGTFSPTDPQYVDGENMPLPPFVPPSLSTLPSTSLNDSQTNAPAVPPAPEGWVQKGTDASETDTKSKSQGASHRTKDAPSDLSTSMGSDSNHQIMPPPLGADPWSSSLSTD